MNRDQDMHPADIIAMLHKRKLSLAALSRRAGLSSSTLANALSGPWPKGEKIIAEALEKMRRRSGPVATTINMATMLIVLS